MEHSPESFRIPVPPQAETAPSEKLLVHDAASFERYLAGFGTEMRILSRGCGLDRPTGEQQIPPAEEVLNVSSKNAIEPNRSSANNYLAELVLQGDERAYNSFVDIQRQKNLLDILSKETFDEEHRAMQELFASPEDFLLFQAVNAYSDLGKADELIAWAQEIDDLKGCEDHDRIVEVVLQPEHTAARQRFMPSFDGLLTPEQQESARRILSCGLHLAQLNNGQAIPKNLEGFYTLTPKEKRILFTQAIFDIGGAQGDTIKNGTQTLTETMYRRLKGQIDILLSDVSAHLPPAQRAQNDYGRILAFHNQNLGLGLDPANNPIDRALVRTAMMFRDISSKDLQKLPDIFTTRLGEVTQALVVDFMNATGYEQEGQGALMSMYSSTAAAKLYSQYRRAGNSHEAAMAVALQFIARLNSAVRQYIDITDTPMTNVVARNLVQVAQSSDWANLLRQEIVAEKTGIGYARVRLKRQPTLVRGRPHINYLATPDDAQLSREGGLWIAGGGGGDSWTTAFLTKHVFNQADPTVVSVWGEPENIQNADPIGEAGRIFKVKRETVIRDTRHMEPLLAARGIATFLICLERRPDGTNNLIEDFRWFADYLDDKGRRPSHIALVDTGGDVLAPSSLTAKRPERDHLSLQAARHLQHVLRITGNLMVAAPGVDAPDTMNDVAEQTGVSIIDLAPYGQRFIELANEDTIMTANPARYSRMLQSLYYALHPQTQEGQFYGNQPLLLPTSQALRRVAARPAFNVVTPQMSELHVYDLARVAAATGVSL